MSSALSSKCARTSPPTPPFSNGSRKLTKRSCCTMERYATSTKSSFHFYRRRHRRQNQKSASMSKRMPLPTGSREKRPDPDRHDGTARRFASRGAAQSIRELNRNKFRAPAGRHHNIALPSVEFPDNHFVVSFICKITREEIFSPPPPIFPHPPP